MAGTGKKKWLPHGCGGRVRELPNGRFQGQLELPDNKYRSIGGTFPDGFTAARETLNAIEDAKKIGVERYLQGRRSVAEFARTQQAVDRPKDTPYTFRWWAEKWLESTKRPGAEEGVLENLSVYENRRGCLENYVYPYLGEKLMTELTFGDFWEWLEKLKVHKRADGKPGPVSARRIGEIHKLVRQILKAGVQRREIPGFDRSPLEIGLELPKVVTKKMGYPEFEQFRLIVSNAEEWAQDLMIWQCFCGLRLGESLGLDYDDPRPNGIWVSKQLSSDRRIKYRGPTKDHTERVQPLAMPARYALSRQLARWPDTGVRFPKYAIITDPATLIWRSEKGKFLTRSRWNGVWHEAREKAGVPYCRPHDLRRAFGNYLIDQGVEIRVVQILLGHANVTTTEKYLGRSQKRAAEGIKALDSFLIGAPKPEIELPAIAPPPTVEAEAKVIMGELLS